jgi:hypothetical protein
MPWVIQNTLQLLQFTFRATNNALQSTQISCLDRFSSSTVIIDERALLLNLDVKSWRRQQQTRACFDGQKSRGPSLGDRRRVAHEKNEMVNEQCLQFPQNENFNTMHNRSIVAVIRVASIAEFTNEHKMPKKWRFFRSRLTVRWRSVFHHRFSVRRCHNFSESH